MYKVDRYEFETKEQAKIALREEEQIRYIKSQTMMKDPDMVLNLYNKLILKEVFVTPVGIGFLRELQDYLNTIPYIKNEDILPIPVYRPQLVTEENEKEEAAVQKKVEQRRRRKENVVRKASRKKNRDYRKLFHISTFLAVVFALVIVGMFAITCLSTNNVNIINYENEIINRYETWEKQLDEKEEQLRQREERLEKQEAVQNE
ncbi:MAG: hypothetical protein PUF65_01685 [Lachnospiraceae bacterium]|nr:hypothetical protein [Lachnospiraceae bacterium]